MPVKDGVIDTSTFGTSFDTGGTGKIVVVQAAIAYPPEFANLSPEDRVIAQDVMQDGTGDVIRHVGHQGPWILGQSSDVDVEEVALDHAQGLLALEA